MTEPLFDSLMDRMMFIPRRPLTAEEQRDVEFFTSQIVKSFKPIVCFYPPPTVAFFRKFGVEIFDGPFFASYDVVGQPHRRNEIEQHRPMGVLFRYFDSHRQRIDEFAGRLAAFEKRWRREQ